MKLSVLLQDSYIRALTYIEREFLKSPTYAPPWIGSKMIHLFTQCRAHRFPLVRSDLRLFCLLTTLAGPSSPGVLRLIL